MRSRLVAEMIRTSTFTGLRAPTGSTSFPWIARNSFTCAGGGSSPTSSRNSVPPVASTNLPVWRSVARVKAPFSWPNRIDSTRLSGMAPQLTATNGLARRSPVPWMARAISSLPTPDWPSISTGMADPAAFSAVRSTAWMRPLRGVMSLNGGLPLRLRLRGATISLRARGPRGVCAGGERVAQGHLQPLGPDRFDHEVAGARAHGGDHVVDAAVGGLHDDGRGEAGIADPGEHAEPVEIGHHEVEHDRVDARAVR